MAEIKETALGSAECPLWRPFKSPLQYDRQSTYLIVFVVITTRLLREQDIEKFSRTFSTLFIYLCIQTNVNMMHKITSCEYINCPACLGEFYV